MNGPTWEVVATASASLIIFLLGIIITLVGVYAKQLGRRVEQLERAHQDLNNHVLSQYHSKTEINGLLAEIKDRVNSLHSRFDMVINSQHIKE